MITPHHVSEHPVVLHVERLLTQAIEHGASDIHLEPTQHGLRVRMRLDGMLHDHETIDAGLMLQIISRLKVLAHIDIAEKRVPQDGKFCVSVNGRSVDLRISTFPSLFGEKVVVRILDRAQHMLTLEELGFSDEQLTIIQQLLSKSSGFFLVSGPTGSGKTTTLYAMLSALNRPDRNIVTLEDPVEYNVEGITQGQIHPDAGFTFERGIRALLRQDPDVLMVGEIRDRQTARVAIEAALTGHIVLSTVHTNDAPSIFMRIMDMGVEPFLLNASVVAVLAQRLVRVLCDMCKKPAKLNQAQQTIAQSLGIQPDETVFAAVGCNTCSGIGYKGRIGIFELLVVSEGLRNLITAAPKPDALYAQALADGMCTLAQDGIKKVREGKISLQELLRVVH